MNFLRAALSDRSLVVSEFARQIGRTRRTVYNWRRGRTRPSSADVVRIAAVLGVSTEFLLAPIDELLAARPPKE